MGVARQLKLLASGVDATLPEGELERKLVAVSRGERPPLRVKFGMDPTAPDIHLGHAVILRKLRTFQEFGHTVVLIIGGFTARLGDPSGKSMTRPQLSAEQVQEHAATYVAQARKILLPEPLEIVDNSTWLSRIMLTEVVQMTSRITVARMLERQDFSERYRAQRPIAVSEFLYPILQGQDSVEVRADIELGGTDQTFNVLYGRDAQIAAGQQPQTVMVMPLLEGTDGTTKMSKTTGNAIGITEEPAEIFGKVMSIPDQLMPHYYLLAAGLPPEQAATEIRALEQGTVHPAEAKRRLAKRIVTLYHSPEDAQQAEQRFDIQFRERGIPEDIPQITLPDTGEHEHWHIPDLLITLGLTQTKSEARRLMASNGIRLNGQPLTDPNATLPVDALRGSVMQRGKRHFVRIA
ncbi:MAG: tyrosine--tRNA ligase [Egibacteraceae bacterium]